MPHLKPLLCGMGRDLRRFRGRHRALRPPPSPRGRPANRGVRRLRSLGAFRDFSGSARWGRSECWPSEAHHIRFAQQRALGRKVSDEYTVPVCRLHHRELHRYGDEASWWVAANVDPVPIALALARTMATLPNEGGVGPDDQSHLCDRMLAGPCADGTFDRFEFAAFNDWARRDAIEDAQFDGAGRHRFDAGPGRGRDKSAECPGKWEPLFGDAASWRARR
jgi:hypothetical protein